MLFTAALVAAVESFLLTSTAHAQVKTPNRMIQLEEIGPVAGGQGQQSPSAQVFIFQQNENSRRDVTFVHFMVNSLPWQPRGGSYSLYAYTPTLPRCHVATFNTSSASSGFSSFAFLCDDRSDSAWLADPVWLEIYFEEDDGLEAPDTGAIPILYGFSAPPAAEKARR